MDPEKVGIFSVEKSRLPFKGNFKIVKKATYQRISGALKGTIPGKDGKRAIETRTFVIDDSQYLMVNEFFDKAQDAGYQKYTEIGKHFRDLIHIINHQLPDDVIVFFLHHVEVDSNTGKIKAKTVGKMLDNYLTVEGCFDIVLYTIVDGNQHFFLTQNDGYNTAKSPEGMLEAKIPNDLAVVETAVREYYSI